MLTASKHNTRYSRGTQKGQTNRSEAERCDPKRCDAKSCDFPFSAQRHIFHQRCERDLLTKKLFIAPQAYFSCTYYVAYNIYFAFNINIIILKMIKRNTPCAIKIIFIPVRTCLLKAFISNSFL